MCSDSNFTLDLAKRPGYFLTARRRHDAVRAILVAAATDRHKRGDFIRSYEPRRQLFPFVAIIDCNLRRRSLLTQLDKRRRQRQIVCANNKIDNVAALDDVLTLLLSDAAANTNH